MKFLFLTCSHQDRECYITDCGDPGALIDGTVTLSSGTTYLSEATFSCDTGYTLSAVVTRICQADTTWSNANPTCDINGKL